MPNINRVVFLAVLFLSPSVFSVEFAELYYNDTCQGDANGIILMTQDANGKLLCKGKPTKRYFEGTYIKIKGQCIDVNFVSTGQLACDRLEKQFKY